jgi:predicted DCC family thiol-disulfide oxidoreductase YuxK
MSSIARITMAVDLPIMEYGKRIVFFDGECNLCNGFVNFLVSADKNRQFYIASLQGETAKDFLAESERLNLSTIVYLDEFGHKYYKSGAVFKILPKLGKTYAMIKIFQFLPRQITDYLYDLVAKDRYRLFGKSEVCRLPTEEERQYFLA